MVAPWWPAWWGSAWLCPGAVAAVGRALAQPVVGGRASAAAGPAWLVAQVTMARVVAPARVPVAPSSRWA